MLLGRAVGPVFFHSGNNTEMATFTLVTSEVRKNRSNELIKRSEFHKVQIFIPRLVNKARNVVQKGFVESLELFYSNLSNCIHFLAREYLSKGRLIIMYAEMKMEINISQISLQVFSYCFVFSFKV